MTVSYSAIEIAVLDLLKNTPELAGVKTFERTVRECLFSGEKLTQGFRSEELPAINVTSELEPGRSEPFTTGEIKYTIPVSVLIITKHLNKAQARRDLQVLIQVVEKVLNAARKTDGLGLNTLVMGEIVSSVVVAEENPHHFAVGNVTASVIQVVER